MENILYHLHKERNDQRMIACVLVFYTILLIIIGHGLSFVLSIENQYLQKERFFWDKIEEVLFFFILFFKKKHMISLIFVAYRSVAFGYSIGAMFSTVSQLADLNALFLLIFFMRNTLALSALLYLTLAIFSHASSGRLRWGKLSFLQTFFFSVGISFATDFACNYMTSVLVKGCTNAIQSL